MDKGYDSRSKTELSIIILKPGDIISDQEKYKIIDIYKKMYEKYIIKSETQDVVQDNVWARTEKKI